MIANHADWFVGILFVGGFLLWCSVLETRVNELEEQLHDLKRKI